MADQNEDMKIQVDSDWKAQAQAEKERLSDETENAEARSGAGAMPEANFQTLVSTMATQALFAMGAIPDPRTGQRIAHLDLARHHIDMLTVIEAKTKGNLDEEEEKMLGTTLYELRNTYIQLSTAQRTT